MTCEKIRGNPDHQPKDSTPESMEQFFHRMEDPWNYKCIKHAKRGDVLLSFLSKHTKGQINRLLDVGCAEGYLTHILSDIAKKTIGIDVSKTAINRAVRDFGGMCDFQVGDLPNLKTKIKFDCVSITGTLYYVVDRWTSVMKVLDRLLRKGSLLLVSHVKAGSDGDGYLKRLQATGMFDLVDSLEFTCNSNVQSAHLFRKK